MTEGNGLKAFTKYALDVLLREMRYVGTIDTATWTYLDGIAERILRAAQTEEPLP